MDMYRAMWVFPDHRTVKMSTCLEHIAWTMGKMGTPRVILDQADPATHTCKGCLGEE